MSEDKPRDSYRGRLAPTPSGFLHEGHVRTFRTAWNRAREFGGSLIFRLDDLDLDRCKQEFIEACFEDMRGMKLDWDEGPDIGGEVGPYRQSQRSEFYLEALTRLLQLGLIYPCKRSRTEIRSFSMLSRSGEEFLFPKEFRPKKEDFCKTRISTSINWRFRTDWGKEIKFKDEKKAEQTFLLGTDLSDFLVWRQDGVAAYELATVVDDHYMNITEIVRGEDLLASSARQCLLFDALGWERPFFYHCDLLRGEDGKKLSKSSRCLPRLFSAF